MWWQSSVTLRLEVAANRCYTLALSDSTDQTRVESRLQSPGETADKSAEDCVHRQ